MRYTFTPEDREKRSGRRKLEVIEILTQGPATAAQIGEQLGIHGVSAYYCLERLRKRGMVRCDEGPVLKRIYRIDDAGLESIEHLTKRDELMGQLQGLQERAKYEDLTSFGGLVEGPVSLMRIPEADSVDQITRRILPQNVVVEKKFDGWLCQSAGGRLYSRRGIELTQKFPLIAKAASYFPKEHLVGELVYWTPEGKMSEPDVTRIAGTLDPADAIAKLAKMPGVFQFIVFDILARGGEDISDRPFIKRREILEKTVKPGKHLVISPLFKFEHWKRAYEEALAEGGEGAVFKNAYSPYFWRELGQKEAQPAGIQMKLKAVRTDEFVVYQLGKSEKGKLLLFFGQFWKGRLVPVGDVNNLSEDMETEMIRRIDEGPFVVELAFQERFPKPPGKLRNPRFMKFRDDKPIESVTLPREFAPK